MSSEGGPASNGPLAVVPPSWTPSWTPSPRKHEVFAPFMALLTEPTAIAADHISIIESIHGWARR
eukprot:622973-Pyramimonas_sp.AAC.1